MNDLPLTHFGNAQHQNSTSLRIDNFQNNFQDKSSNPRGASKNLPKPQLKLTSKEILTAFTKTSPNQQSSSINVQIKHQNHIIPIYTVHKILLSAFCPKLKESLLTISVLQLDVEDEQLDMRKFAIKMIIKFIYTGELNIDPEIRLKLTTYTKASQLLRLICEYIDALGVECLVNPKLQNELMDSISERRFDLSCLVLINEKLRSIHAKFFLHSLEQFREEGVFTDAEIWLVNKDKSNTSTHYNHNQLISKVHLPLLKEFIPSLAHQLDENSNKIWVEGLIPGDGLKYTLDYMYGTLSDFDLFAFDEIENIKVASLFLGFDKLSNSITKYQNQHINNNQLVKISQMSSQMSNPTYKLQQEVNDMHLSDDSEKSKNNHRYDSDYYNNNYQNHTSNTNSKVRTIFTCTICSKTFNYMHNLETHMKTHVSTQQQFTCTYCSPVRSFAQKRYLRAHMRQMHLDILNDLADSETRPAKGKYVCEHEGCGKVLSTQRNLDNHNLNTHSDIRRFACGYENCTKRFRYKCDLQRHEREHNGTMFGPCQTCGKMFNHKGNFKRHVKKGYCLGKPEKITSIVPRKQTIITKSKGLIVPDFDTNL